jgi:hypothetical protein
MTDRNNGAATERHLTLGGENPGEPETGPQGYPGRQGPLGCHGLGTEAASPSSAVGLALGPLLHLLPQEAADFCYSAVPRGWGTC